ncbi:MAG: hypothetical protein RMM53_06355, partial [Bacteroidia bacterium]|nr:hypothetical protein [Bacteroidia bacterium]MDW8333818.1 hypothetical protein [Bacteroidia bacterium]
MRALQRLRRNPPPRRGKRANAIFDAPKRIRRLWKPGRQTRFWALTLFARLVGAASSLYLVVFGAAFLVLESEDVQRRLTPYLARSLSDALGLEVEIQRIGLRLFDKLEIRGLTIYDKRCARMIAAEKVRIAHFAIPLFEWLHDPRMRKDVDVRSVELIRPELRLYRPLGERIMNIDEAFKSEKTSDDPSPALPRLQVRRLAVRQMHFSYRDSAYGFDDHAPRPLNLNYKNLCFFPIDLNAGVRLWETGELELDLERLTGTETNSGVVLKHFSTEFAAILTIVPRKAPSAPILQEYIHPFDETYYPRPNVEPTAEPTALHPPAFSLYGYDTIRTIHFRNTCFDAGGARLDFDMRLENLGLNKLFAPGQNRRYVVDFRRSVVDFAVINYFTPSALPLEGMPTIESGSVRGDYRAMRARDLVVRYGDHTLFNADFRLDDFTDEQKLFLDLRLEQGKTALSDLDALLKTVRLPEPVRRLDSLTVVGRYHGFLRDFVVDAQVQTPRGGANANLRFVLDEQDRVRYQGEIQTRDLDLDRLFDLHGVCDRLNVSGRVEGKNFDPETAEGNFVLTALNSRAVGYDLDTLRADIALYRGRITGHASLADSQAGFDGTLDVDFLNSPQSYEFSGELEKADLAHWLEIPGRYFLTTKFSGRFTADSLENLRGGVGLRRLTLGDSTHARTLEVEHLTAAVYRDSLGIKHGRIAGSPFDLRFRGKFGYKDVYRRFERYFRQFWDYIREKDAPDSSFVDNEGDVHGELTLRLLEIAPVVRFFEPQWMIADGAKISLRWSADTISLKTFVDSAAFAGVRIGAWETEWELARSNAEFSAEGFSYAQALALTPDVGLVSVQLTGAWRGRTLDFVAGAIQDTLNDYFMLKGRGRFPQGASVRIELDDAGSMLFLLGRTWRFAPA